MSKERVPELIDSGRKKNKMKVEKQSTPRTRMSACCTLHLKFWELIHSLFIQKLLQRFLRLKNKLVSLLLCFII